MRQKLLILLFAIMATVNASAYDFSYDYNGQTLYFNKTSGSTCEVAKGNGPGNISIPSEVVNKGKVYSVTSIGEKAFSSCRSLESIEIPNSVTSIGDGAFGYCESLTSIEIPNSVTYIGSSAFKYCSSLTSIEIPNSVTSIDRSTFHGCESLTSITIPNSIIS